MINSTGNNDSLSSFWNFLKLLGINVLTKNEKVKESFRMKAYKLFMIFVVLSSLVIVFCGIFQVPFGIYTVTQVIQVASIQLMYFNVIKSNSQLCIVKKYLNFLPIYRKYNPYFKILHVLINLSICIMLFSPIYGYFTDFSKMKRIDVHFKAWFSFMYLMAYHFLVLVVPVILTSFFCAICYQWKEIIIYVKSDLQKRRACFIDLERMHIARNLLQKCRLIWNGTNLIKNTFPAYCPA